MDRRQFIVASGLGAVTALSGCLGNKAPPPRKSNVVADFQTTNGALVINLAGDTWVTSRYDSTEQSLARLNPIGVASAKGKSGGGGGRGASGRGTGGYSSAPRTKRGYAWYHGGDYADDWYENHGDEVTRYPVTIAALGIAYIGSTSRLREEAPSAGAIAWDKTYRNPNHTVEYPLAGRPSSSREGWYRVGANIVGTGVDHNFRWECYDLEIRSGPGAESFAIEEQWKVSPRI